MQRVLTSERKERRRQSSKKWADANRETIRKKAALHAEENRIKAKAWYEANRERGIKARREYYAKNRTAISERRKEEYAVNKEAERTKQLVRRSNPLAKEKARIRAREWATDNPEKKREQDSRYYQANSERIRGQVKDYHRNNKAKTRAWSARSTAKRLQRIPGWLRKEDWVKIEDFYILAAKMTAETGIKHQVDHVIPLNGRTVSGLHVPENLQVITAEENHKKRNKYPYHPED